MVKKSDEELMVAYSKDSIEAFEELYLRYNKQLYSFILRKTGDRQSAEDIFQGAFIKLHKSKSRYLGDIPFKKWLFTICQSELIDYKRKEKKDIQASKDMVATTDSATHSPENPFNLIDTDDLTREEQSLLKYRYQDDLEFYEIAQRIGVSQSSARKRVSRLLHKLRQKHGGKAHE